MTNERAIELLNRISDSQFDGEHGDERREALEMAVRALFSQQIVNDSQGLVNDCISRKMAIDEVKRLHDVAWANWKETRISANTMIDALKDLPSAQPETHDKRTETHECDLINRQQAIDVLKGLPTWWADGGGYYGGAQPPMVALLDPEDAVSAIENLPSAQPERKTGRWKLLYDNIWICTNCEQTEQFGVNIESTSDYCPNCGARMER